MVRKAVVAGVMLLAATTFTPAAHAHGDDADVILEWNLLLQQTVPASAGFQSFRYYAMLHVAMFDAVNSIEERYAPYRVRVRSSHGASAEAAAAQAAHDVLASLIPASLAAYDAALTARLATIPRGQARQGVRVGQKVAAEILAWRLNDGWHLPPPAYVNPPFTGLWQPTPPATLPAAFTQFRGVKPFATLSSTQFLHANPPTLTSAQYAEDFNEVKDVGKSDSATRTAEQTLIARNWASVLWSPGPNVVWNEVGRQVVGARGLCLVDAARAMALLNVAINDAIQTAHTGKFVYGLWRPVTAIPRADEDLNDATEADPTWMSLVPTPPYPSYPGNMACVGASSATALALALGTNDVSFTARWRSTAQPPLPDTVRSYTGFWQLAEEEAMARVWGGIHFRFDNEASQLVCPKVAQFVYDNYMQERQ
jgi:hypothetical protein